ncbi:MAG TPA: ABC transporter permease [Cyclobacteriaceae bacterium]|nr:ABC transporter permease [Cyclobacteriaceae bacterium]
MWKNYLLLFFRNLRRQRLFSTINLLGLTVSISSALFIYLYVRHEFSYDRFHSHADRIYRVNQTFIWGENDNNQFASTGPGVATALREELPEAELITSIHTPGNSFISYTNPTGEIITFEEDEVLAADTNFFKMFSFPLLKGNATSALKQANTLVMTESTAKKYFKNEDPIGKLVRLGKAETQQTYEVTGIVQDIPENSYIEFNVLLSLNSFPAVERLHWSWVWTQLETFIRLKENTDLENTRTKLAKIPSKYAEETLQRVMNVSYEEYIKSGKKWELFLQPMLDIHLPDQMVYNRLNESGNKKIVYSLIGVAGFILLLSCVNFMNLSTAQFTRRVKEASIRKILGLGRKELSMNYFLEALAFCVIALVLALAIAQLLLPAFNLITGKSLQLDLFGDSSLIISLIGLVVSMAVIASSYPTFFLTGFHPVEGVKGKLKAGSKGKAFRSGLVVFQFSVSIILIVCTAIVYQQLNFVSEKDLGFNKENLLSLSHVEHVKDAESMASAALNVSGVVSATWCSSLPPEVYGGDKFSAEGMNNQTFALNYTSADEQFVPTLDIKLKYGRNFSKDMPGDEERVILNEAAIKRIGWTADESALGRKIESPGGEIKFEVIGIVGDFNYWSLENSIEPMAIFHIKSKNLFGVGDKRYLALRIEGQTSQAWENTIAEVTTLWKTHAGDSPVQYEFVDQAFADTFKTQQQFGKTLTVMATLAIMIAALGLLGMIIYTLEQRTKEIGIRKVSGASVLDILKLISKGYTQLIIVAFIIGAPLSYWIMQQWLQDFSYRITPSLWIYGLVGIGTLLIAMLITGYHSVKAALTNPVDVLKDE